jgi:hypothetical protein
MGAFLGGVFTVGLFLMHDAAASLDAPLGGITDASGAAAVASTRMTWVPYRLLSWHTLSGPIISLLGAAYYGGGPAQGVDKLDPHAISSLSTRKRTLRRPKR